MGIHSVAVVADAPRGRAAAAAAAAPPRVAVLYSGRWFGTGDAELGWQTTQQWAANHLRYLITPNNASVFVVASPSNWCGPPAQAREQVSVASATETLFQAEVRAAFRGWHDLHAALIPQDEGLPQDGAYAAAAVTAIKREALLTGSNKTGHYGFVTAMMRNWYWQFSHYMRAEQLRRSHGPHDWVVRVRLDVQFAATLHARALARRPVPLGADAGVIDTAAMHAATAATAHEHTIYCLLYTSPSPRDS